MSRAGGALISIVLAPIVWLLEAIVWVAVLGWLTRDRPTGTPTDIEDVA
ncbi:hypothetical protein [Gordonia amicalis]|uniref:Uncharacterized protein n=1 Tax=Gordonia amicalis TaxID=89053 RepID=A0ABU4DK43_9ACTN|nr:hypothetical protein [Gordonia amicalis]MDV6310030.1 hypothetical protein [Gordonia amicalis]